jgi:hypothetical protein
MVALFLLAALQTVPAASPKTAAAVPQDPLAAFTVYDGAWSIQSAHTAAGLGKPDVLVNHCSRNVAFYSCEQVVNGKSSALVIFVSASEAGKYYTQIVLPNGYSTGRGDLTLDGAHWTYFGKDVEKDKTTYFRTENYFTGRDAIHFEQFQSTDGTKWDKTNEGDETRQKS